MISNDRVIWIEIFDSNRLLLSLARSVRNAINELVKLIAEFPITF